MLKEISEEEKAKILRSDKRRARPKPPEPTPEIRVFENLPDWASELFEVEHLGTKRSNGTLPDGNRWRLTPKPGVGMEFIRHVDDGYGGWTRDYQVGDYLVTLECGGIGEWNHLWRSRNR